MYVTCNYTALDPIIWLDYADRCSICRAISRCLNNYVDVHFFFFDSAFWNAEIWRSFQTVRFCIACSLSTLLHMNSCAFFADFCWIKMNCCFCFLFTVLNCHLFNVNCLLSNIWYVFFYNDMLDWHNFGGFHEVHMSTFVYKTITNYLLLQHMYMDLDWR